PFVQKWTTTTFPRRSASLNGFEFNQSVTPVNSGARICVFSSSFVALKPELAFESAPEIMPDTIIAVANASLPFIFWTPCVSENPPDQIRLSRGDHSDGPHDLHVRLPRTMHLINTPYQNGAIDAQTRLLAQALTGKQLLAYYCSWPISL